MALLLIALVHAGRFRQSTVLLFRDMLIDDDGWSALEPPQLAEPTAADDNGEPHVLDSWQSDADDSDAPLVLVAKHVPLHGCERCVVAVDGECASRPSARLS